MPDLEAKSIGASGVYRLLFPDCEADDDIDTDVYSLLLKRALPGSISTALSYAPTQRATSHLERMKRPSHFSSGSVHGGSFVGVRGFKELRIAAAVKKSTPQQEEAAQDDFLVREARSEQERAVAEREAADRAVAQDEAKRHAKEQAGPQHLQALQGLPAEMKNTGGSALGRGPASCCRLLRRISHASSEPRFRLASCARLSRLHRVPSLRNAPLLSGYSAYARAR